ncbi:PTS system, fructose-specific IIB-like component [Enterococcus sp. DIV2402]|uniref:PTS system, fructose-specific IIB-like component n=1 Tax=Candidatus Enterococcus lowellii TaxID=2230877 RepID=A0ABZ2SP70_9ENTE|nr:fructose PTS transporter subunit IIB [Enterococcus sp. DIV2402]MBO0463751.1 PTS fructose transporter subunit IIB [Enterococcus sp. DIV2402]
MKVIGISACPTGIAHTYMAADSVENAVKKRNGIVKMETQGSIGIENKLTKADIESADLIIFTAAVTIREEERFEGFEDKIIEVSLQDAIGKIDRILDEYFEGRN